MSRGRFEMLLVWMLQPFLTLVELAIIFVGWCVIGFAWIAVFALGLIKWLRE